MIQFDAQYSLIDDASILKLETKLQPELETLQKVHDRGGYDDERASINLPDDTELRDRVLTLATKYTNVDAVVLVGIGGSSLGAMAVQEAVQGRLHNAIRSPRIFYAETVDPIQLAAQGEIVAAYLKAKKRVVVNVISKSGTTTETVVNAAFFIALLRKHKAPLADCLVFTTDEGSKLWQYAESGGFDRLALVPKASGRYSVASASGLFPLALMGVDITELHFGMAEMRDRCLAGSVAENPAALSAAILAGHHAEGRRLHDTFLFSVDLEALGKWYRQLMGESIGKEHDRRGKRVRVGITPTVSIGSTDLHSMVQLYLGGPHDKVTTFVRVGGAPSPIVPPVAGLTELVPYIESKPVSAVMDAIFDGTLAAYRRGKRPYMTIDLPDRGARSIGQLMQLKLIEMMLLGSLLRVNPFDQPAVELYKVETQRLLATA